MTAQGIPANQMAFSPPASLLEADDPELERIDIKHHVAMLLSGGNLHLAPLLNPRRILDIGTGTGIWAIEMAEKYPESQECRHRHTKPGGYFELQELDCRFSSDDGTLLPTSNLAYWSDMITEAAAEYNRPIPHYTDYVHWFEKAGFTDIRQVVFKSPTNPWPKNKLLKEVGRFQLVAHIEGLEGISLGLLTRGLEWKPEEVKVLMAKIRPELKDRGIHSYQTKVFVTGRKPDKLRPSGLSISSTISDHSSTAPPTPRSFSSSNVGSPVPAAGDSPMPPEQINAFTPTMPLKQEGSR
ncbi:MAG: hypothetical protein Q9220_005004 [cf. Caloplaca sp. 1 TL-2023]